MNKKIKIIFSAILLVGASIDVKMLLNNDSLDFQILSQLGLSWLLVIFGLVSLFLSLYGIYCIYKDHYLLKKTLLTYFTINILYNLFMVIYFFFNKENLIQVVRGILEIRGEDLQKIEMIANPNNLILGMLPLIVFHCVFFIYVYRKLKR